MDHLKKLLSTADFSAAKPYERCLCLKLVPLEQCRKIYSGVKNYLEILCPDCRKNLRDMARIVCVGCGRLAAFLPPQRHKCGFFFEKGKHYHIRECSFCVSKRVAATSTPPVVACPVIELEAFAKERTFRTEADPDIVRSTEQIVLPADSEFERMAKRVCRIHPNES